VRVLVDLGDCRIVLVGVLVGRSVVCVRMAVLDVVVVVDGVLVGVRRTAVGVLVRVDLAHDKSLSCSWTVCPLKQ
jgi:hypothetical protein